MLGAIIGDIVGSRFEWHNIKTKEFDFFTDDCSFTDDSILTLAVGKALLESGGDDSVLAAETVRWLREIGRPYPGCGFGGMFLSWIYGDDPRPYGSYGNGAAMRVSGCGWAADTLEQAIARARLVTAVTHDHPEGLRGAEATAAAVFLARQGCSHQELRNYIEANYYPLDFTLDEIRAHYTFNETCQQTVPQALAAFLESHDFEDAIRNAVSLGGDSDTLAAITGGVAEACYGIPDSLRQQSLTFLDQRLLTLLQEFEAVYPPTAGKGGAK